MSGMHAYYIKRGFLMRSNNQYGLFKGIDGRLNIVLSAFLFASLILFTVATIGTTDKVSANGIVHLRSELHSGPWVVKSNGKVLAYVKDSKTGEQIVTGLKIKYCDSIVSQQRAEVKELVTVEKAPLRAYAAKEILDAGQAVEKIAKMNEDAQIANKKEAPVTVALNEVVEEDKAVKYKTKVIKTDELVRGEKEVKVKGEYGNKHVISDVAMENGEYAGSTILDTEVTDKAVTKVVYEGTKLSTQDKGELLVQYATRFLGTKYVLGGGDLRKGIDCSHFTAAMYGKLGIKLVAYSYDQEKAGTEVKYEDAQPGDLILYPGHVGIYMGNNMMIHATPDEVKITDDCRYRKITCVRRIFTDEDNVTQDMFDKLFEEEYNEGAKEIADEKLAKLDYYTMKDKNENSDDESSENDGGGDDSGDSDGSDE